MHKGWNKWYYYLLLLLLNPHVEARDKITHHVEGESDFSESSSPSDSVKISLAVRLAVDVDGQVKIYHDCHLHNNDNIKLNYWTNEKQNFLFTNSNSSYKYQQSQGMSTTTIDTGLRQKQRTNLGLKCPYIYYLSFSLDRKKERKVIIVR